jgi:uncharacterized membrane protein YgcG
MRGFRTDFLCAAACGLGLGLIAVPNNAFGQSTTQVNQSSYPQQQPAATGGWRKVGDPPTAAEEASANEPQANTTGIYDPDPDGPRGSQNNGPHNSPPQNYGRQNEPPPAPPQQLTIPAGTYVTVRANGQISSNKSRVGDMFTATLEQPIVVNGIVVASPGETVTGRVTEAEKAGRIEGLARLGVQLTQISLVDGQQVPIQSQFIDQVGPGSKGRDAGTIAATTATGAAIGAAAGWGVGAAIGAGAGAAAGTIGVLTTRGHASVIGPEQVLTFRTLQPVTIVTTSAPQAFRYVDPNEYDYYSQASQQQTIQYQQAATPPPSYYYGYGAPYYYGAGFGYGYGYPYAWGGYPYWSGFYYGPSLYIGGWGGRYYGGRYYYGGHYYNGNRGGYVRGWSGAYRGGTGFHGGGGYHGGGGVHGGGGHGGGHH